MILKPREPKAAAPTRLAGAAASNRPVLTALAIAFSVVALLAGFALKFDVGTSLRRSLTELGFISTHQSRSSRGLIRLPGRWLATRFSAAEVPMLALDIKFKDLQALQKRRDEALREGLLQQREDDYVSAAIRLDNRRVRVKLRLKGDLVDHFTGDQWSFRVHTKDDDHIFGLRRFSIQHPRVRDFHIEPLFFAAMAREGILAPRYFFADVRLNGDDYGTMAIEEHFSKELLEWRHRTESVILRFDESLFWAASDGFEHGFYGVFDNFASAPITAFGSGRVAESPRLREHFAVASGLLQGFARGELQAGEVFDTRLFGRYVAVAELWGARHALRWHNQRFYYNPTTARLEPIAFDSGAGHALDAEEMVSRREPIVVRMLEDPVISAEYLTTLERIGAELEEGLLGRELGAIESGYLEVLRPRYPLLDGFDFERLSRRADRLLALVDRPGGLPYPDYPALAHARVYDSGGVTVVEITNAVPHPIEAVSVSWADPEGGARTGEIALGDGSPLLLEASPKAAPPSTLRVPLTAPRGAETWVPELTVRIRGHARLYRTTALPGAPALTTRPVAPVGAETLARQYEFLDWDPRTRRLGVRPGTWSIETPLVVGSDVQLTVGARTTLAFAPEAALISYGPVEFSGSASDRILLKPLTPALGWQGVAVLAGGRPSSWKHVSVQATTGIDQAGWKLTSGVTFYQSPIQMHDCVFSDNRTEDALNVVRSQYSLQRIHILDAVSDGFDSDFSDGVIQSSRFERIGSAGGGDAIDASGSRIEIREVAFQTIGDKALSIGEGSVVTADHVEIDGASVGAASKDGSRLHLRDSRIRNAALAPLMAYVKKPEYGPGKLRAERVSIDRSPRIQAQTGSEIILDGVLVATSDIDVEALYAGVMRPGLRR